MVVVALTVNYLAALLGLLFTCAAWKTRHGSAEQSRTYRELNAAAAAAGLPKFDTSAQSIQRVIWSPYVQGVLFGIAFFCLTLNYARAVPVVVLVLGSVILAFQVFTLSWSVLRVRRSFQRLQLEGDDDGEDAR